LRPLAAAFFLILFFEAIPGKVYAIDLSLDFNDFPKKTADLFRAGFPKLQEELKEIKDFSGKSGSLFIYHDEGKNEYKSAFILGLDLSLFGVDERRVLKNELNLKPFVPLFLALDDYIESVRVSSNDYEERRFISRIAMSVMLINDKGDRFEFYAQTDYFMGIREVIISPNFIYEKKGKKVFMVYMEPTEIVSQVFVLPPARNDDGTLNPVSLVYDFFYFDY
jgi:hypothetical protein